MPLLSPAWRLGAVLALTAAGCSEPPAETVEVRAVYETTVFDGQAATFDHEAIPGVMDAMRMDLPLADAQVVAGLAPGAKVRLSLQTEPRLEVVAAEALPDTTALRLADR